MRKEMLESTHTVKRKSLSKLIAIIIPIITRIIAVIVETITRFFL